MGLMEMGSAPSLCLVQGFPDKLLTCRGTFGKEGTPNPDPAPSAETPGNDETHS